MSDNITEENSNDKYIVPAAANTILAWRYCA